MPSLSKLKFNKSIISTVHDPIPTKQLLTRLQNLFDELSSTDQESVDTQSYSNIKDQLISNKLLKHADQGVQAYVCCCLSDILRIFAPDAPFTNDQLTSIFKAFFAQFKKLGNSQNAYYQQQVYLLKKLAEVRSVILITDLSNSSDLITSIFDIFYNLAATPNFPSKLENVASQILSEIIQESETIPQPVLKLILNQFLNQKNDSLKISNPAFNFSIEICESNIDRMSRQVTQFFSEIIYENNNNEDDDENNNNSISIENLAKIHKLSIQIWKHVPEILNSVMGLFNDELISSIEQIRILSTTTIAQIISTPNSRINFISTHRETYTNWLKKTLDISPQVRCKWVEQVPRILSNRVDIAQDITNGLTKSLLDTDEKIRLASVKAIAQIPYDIFITNVANTYIMNTLQQLIRERHSEIRNEIIKFTSELYHRYYTNTENIGGKDNTEQIDTLINSIPSNLLKLVYINDKSINQMVDTYLIDKIIPLDTNNNARVTRLLNVFKSLDQKARNSFVAMGKRQLQLSSVVSQFIDFIEKMDNGDHNDKIDKVIKWICVSFPEGYHTYECLTRFYKLQNMRFCKLVKLCLSSQSDFETVKNSIKELLTKLSDSKQIKIDGDVSVSTTDMVVNFKILLYRSSQIFYNKSNLQTLLEIARDSANDLHHVAIELLIEISQTNPEVFKTHLEELIDFIMSDNDSTNKENYLRIIYQILNKLPQYTPIDTAYYSKLSQLAVSGTPMESKFAIRLLSLSPNKDLQISVIFNDVYPLSIKNKNLTTHLSTIVEIMKVDASIIDTAKYDELTRFLITEILLKNQKIGTDNDPIWVNLENMEDDDRKACLNKVLAMKFFVNKLKSLDEDDDNDKINEIAEPVFKLLVSMIGNGGEIVSEKSGTWPTPKHIQSSLRLHSGINIIKLVNYPHFDKLITQQMINKLIFLCQDQVEEIRVQFVQFLQTNLNDAKISEKFIPILFFMAHEPNSILKNDIKTWIKSSTKRKISNNDIKYEKSLVRLIYMISHNPEFTELIEESTKDKASDDILIKAYSYAIEYICFFMETIANQDNVSLLYYFASRIKQYRDNTIDQSLYETSNIDSIQIYKVSELTQLIIKELCFYKNWTTQTWPGKLQLSIDLFSAMKSTKEAQNIISTIFINDVVQARLKIIIKKRIFVSNGKKRSGAVVDNTNKVIAKKIKVDGNY